jgi:RNA polymerase sigma-70 factor (ECF subfamily)
LKLDPRLRRRLDESDLVQETFLRAHAHRDQFQGQTESELLGWLREILKNVAIDLARRGRAQKCDVALEQSLEAAVAESSAQMEALLAAPQSSPSEQAERCELLLRLAGAIDLLPPDWREAILLRDLQGLSVDDTARRMERSARSVAGLLLRGRRRLRELLADLEGSDA